MIPYSLYHTYLHNLTNWMFSRQEIRSMERASARCVAFRMPKQLGCHVLR